MKRALPALMVLSLASLGASAPAKAPSYSIQGRYYETCGCAVSCPCPANRTLPTEGHCDAISLISIDHGIAGATKLDGLKLAVVFRSPHGEKTLDAFGQGKMDHFVLYLDDSASTAQREALGKLLPALFGTQSVQGAKPPQWVPMTFDANGDVARFDIAAGSKLAFEIENVRLPEMARQAGAHGADADRIAIGNAAPFPWVSGITQGISRKFTYDDFGTKWSYESRNAFFGKVAARGTLSN